MSAQGNADEVINDQPPENDDHQSQDENSLPPTPNPSVQVSEASSGYATRAEIQSYFDSFNAAFTQLQGNIMSTMPQHSTQGNGMQPYQFAILQALQQNLHGGRLQPSQTVTSASIQPNQGIQVQSSHPAAPAFLRLAPPDPFASSFGFSHPRNNSQNFTDASQNFPAAFDSQVPTALSVSASCSPIPHYIVDWVIARQFIDFTLLLPSTIDKLPKILPSQENLSGIIRTEMTAIRTFGNWTEAWAVYLGIFAKKAPSKVPDLIAYFLLISKAIRDNPDCGWLAKSFREKAANDTSLVWSAADSSLWVTHMLRRHLPVEVVLTFRIFAIFLTIINVFYKICKFRHVCLYCHSESHPHICVPRRRGLLCLTY